MPPLRLPLAHSTFNLNTAGVAGFFGGEEAISAMATVNLYEGRRWLGWFNTPGSYTIAKRFGRMANSRFWDGLFPGPNDSPAVSFELDGKKGPQYTAAISGTTLHTGHLGYLAMERSKEVRLTEEKELVARTTKSVDVTYLAMKHVKYEPVERQPINSALFGLIPIAISVGTCVLCALVYDWFSFSMILIGIISSGFASFVIGEGKLVIESVKNPAPGVPPGHGILMGEDRVVVIKGKERDVNAITKGHFDLRTDSREDEEKRNDGEKTDLKEGVEEEDKEKQSNGEKTEIKEVIEEEDKEKQSKGDQETIDEKKGDGERGDQKDEKDTIRCYHAIGFCSLLLLLQFLLQLLLVPQGSLFGQTLFLISLGASWVYNSYLSSLEKEKIQAKMLFKALGDPEMLRFRAGTRTTMAVFVCLLVFHGVERSSEERDRELRIKVLSDCVPNDTDVWRRWRKKVVQQLLSTNSAPDSLPYLMEDAEDCALPESDRKFLGTLLKDARAAFKGYFRVRSKIPDDSSHERANEK